MIWLRVLSPQKKSTTSRAARSSSKVTSQASASVAYGRTKPELDKNAHVHKVRWLENSLNVLCDGSHSSWWWGREWRWSRKQSRLTSHEAQAGMLRRRAGWQVKVFLLTLSVADALQNSSFSRVCVLKGGYCARRSSWRGGQIATKF